jgi:hypothetical protein
MFSESYSTLFTRRGYAAITASAVALRVSWGTVQGVRTPGLAAPSSASLTANAKHMCPAYYQCAENESVIPTCCIIMRRGLHMQCSAYPLDVKAIMNG